MVKSWTSLRNILYEIHRCSFYPILFYGLFYKQADKPDQRFGLPGQGTGDLFPPSAKLTFEADQKDYLPQMLGNCVIHFMKRQARLPEETLNITIQLNENKAFVANTACGDLTGHYSVKGMSIKFRDLRYNRDRCGSVEQLDEMERLLTQSVSLCTVNGNMLFQKDNSGNNVFRVTRQFDSRCAFRTAAPFSIPFQ